MQPGDGGTVVPGGVEAMVTVVEAVERELAAFDGEDSALGATALVLAAQLDDRSTSATSKSMCAKALVETLDRVREIEANEGREDRLDELGQRRAGRLAGRAAS